jgi:putative endonuclease
MFSAKRLTGNIFEDKALEYLKNNGYKLVERNYQTPYGEIDLIMTDSKTGEFVFVEVKAVQTSFYGGAADKINRKKLQKIHKSALIYQNTVGKFISMRFDAICFEKARGFETLKHYKSIYL